MKYFAGDKNFDGDAARMRNYFNAIHPSGRLPNDADPRLKFLKQNLNRAAHRENAWEIKIDIFDLWMIGEKQDWRCAVTKELLQFERGGQLFRGQWSNPYSCTIDRIDSSGGYIKGNVHLVTWKYNSFKSDWADEDMKLLCESSLDFLKKIANK